VEHADALVALEDAGGAEGEGDANADGDEAANGEPTAPAAPATELWVQCTDCQKCVPFFFSFSQLGSP
jgi:hypothetical protein